MGWVLDVANRAAREKRDLLEKLGVPSDSSQQLAEWIDETGGLLKAGGADAAVRELVASLHHGAWFRLPGDDSYIVTVAGGRQGCKLGALVFNLIYSLALTMLKKDLIDLGIVLWVNRSTTHQFWNDASASVAWSPGEHSFPVFEVTFVDDECIFLAATSPRILMTAIPKLMHRLCKTFQYFGFQIYCVSNVCLSGGRDIK